MKNEELKIKTLCLRVSKKTYMKRLILYSLIISWTCNLLYAQTELSLDDYKAGVLAYNQDIKIAQQTILAAKDVAKEIRTAYFPQIDGTASYGYDFNPPVLSLNGMNLKLKSPGWNAGGQLMQNIYTGGKLSAEYNSAKIQQDIADLMEDLSVDNISYTAELTYWNAVASKAYWDAAMQYAGILNSLYNIVQTRYEDGLISKMDVLKVETSLKEADYQVSKALQAFDNNCIILNVLMGKSPENGLLLTDSLSIGESVGIDLISYDDVLQRRPDFLVKTKEIDLQKQQGRIENSEFLPKIYAGGSLGYGTLVLNLDNTTIWSPRLFANISIPLFHWGQSRYSHNRNKALVIAKELDQSLMADEIKKELSTALNNLAETAKQIEISKDNLDVAQESLDLHTFSYEEGKASILDVQSVQLSWLQAYANVIQSYLNNKLAVALYRKVVSEP